MTPAQVKSVLHRARLSFRRVMKDASGWLVAPFVAFRRHRGGHEAVSVGGGAVQTMGFLAAIHSSLPTAERVLTGTVAAALALSAGAPADSFEQRSANERGRRAGLMAAPPLDEGVSVTTLDPSTTRNKEPRGEKPDDIALPATVEDVNDVAADATERVKQKLIKHKKKDRVVKRPTSIDVKTVERKAKRRVDRTREKAETVAGQLLTD